MLGIENQRHVEGARVGRARFAAAQHVEKVRRVSEVRPRGERRLSVADAMMHGDRDRDLAQETLGLPQVGLARGFRDVGIEVSQDANRAAQHVHRRRFLRNRAKQINEGAGETTRGGDTLLEIG